MPLRLRLAFFYTVLLIPVVALLAAGGYYFLSDRTQRNADQALLGHLEGVEAVLQAGAGTSFDIARLGAPPLPAAFDLLIVGLNDETLYASSPAASELPNPRDLGARPRHVVDWKGSDGPRRVVYYPLRDRNGELIGYGVGATSIDADVTLGVPGVFLGASAALIVVVTMFGAYFLAGAVLRPVRSVAAAAEEIERNGDFTRRVGNKRRNDEVGQVAAVIDAMIGRVENIMASQRGFLAESSHELRRPLAVIRTNIDVLYSKEIDERDRIAALQDIKLETDMAGRLISDLLLVSKGEQEPFDMQEVDIVRLCAGLVQRGRRWDPGHHHGFSGAGELTVIGDPRRLEQMIQNLLENAAQHTPAGGLVLLKVERNGPNALVSVIDGGAGIPRDEQPHIFERHYRGRHSKQTGRDGLGLGLHIVRFIAERHGGQVNFVSEEGKGSTFTVEVPLASSELLSDRDRFLRNISA